MDILVGGGNSNLFLFQRLGSMGYNPKEYPFISRWTNQFTNHLLL